MPYSYAIFILPLLFSVYICETCHQHGVLDPFAYYKSNSQRQTYTVKD